ncbi:MAG: hypothetical protein J5725_00570 [Bacteroidales bacterium]|nr:hypothetical protein [Bacteroidales bacterium]
MIKVKDFSMQDIQVVCEILNKGHEVHIKRERNNVVIVEEHRKVRAKMPISND